MTRLKRIPTPVSVALIALAGLLLLPRVAGAVVNATIVQLADAKNETQLARVDKQGNLATSNIANGATATTFSNVSVPPGGSVTLKAKPVVGGHLTVFVEANQPGTTTISECVPIGQNMQCAVDYTGPAFAGDNLLHQAADDDVQGLNWQLTVNNTGTISGSYTLVVMDHPTA
jgi:hypothetical protein